MEVILLPSATGPDPEYQFLTTLVFDGELAVDAGSLGLWGDLAAQGRVRHVVLTHAHVDHVASLPIFLENVYGLGPPVVVHGLPDVLDTVRRDLFNGRLFPDLLTEPPAAGPFVVFDPLPPHRPRRVGRHTVTLVPVNHPVPTAAVLVEGGDAAILVVTDTGPTADVWAFAAGRPQLRAVLVEVSFPDELAWLAAASGHLTPTRLAADLPRLPAGVPCHAIHLKPRYRDRVVRELAALGANSPVEPMVPGRLYRFDSPPAAGAG